MSHKREQFITKGYCLFNNIINSQMLVELKKVTDKVLSMQDISHFKRQQTTGSMVLIDWEMAYRYNVMAKFISHPKMLGALAELGFNDPKFGHGRIISKPPHSPPLYWHEDGRFWGDPVSYTSQPIQCFLMVYLTDTTPKNGCLRVIPGSHLKRHPLHDQVPSKQNEAIATYANPEDIVFQRVEGEVDLPMKAGDLVIGYATLFHSAHSNQSDQSRTVLTMWYYPDFVNLPEPSQASVADQERAGGFNQIDTVSLQSTTQALMEPLRIAYKGNAAPIQSQWTPGMDLK